MPLSLSTIPLRYRPSSQLKGEASEDDEDEEDSEEGPDEMPPPPKKMGPRSSVSAEVGGQVSVRRSDGAEVGCEVQEVQCGSRILMCDDKGWSMEPSPDF